MAYIVKLTLLLFSVSFFFRKQLLSQEQELRSQLTSPPSLTSLQTSSTISSPSSAVSSFSEQPPISCETCTHPSEVTVPPTTSLYDVDNASEVIGGCLEEEFDCLIEDYFDEWDDADEVLDGVDLPTIVDEHTVVQSNASSFHCNTGAARATVQQPDSW